MDFQKNYYAILEVERNATSTEIKKAYRRLAKKYHPDVNQGNLEFQEIIKGINEAYEVVGNQENKFIYDQYLDSRNDNPNINENPSPAGPKAKNKRSYEKKSVVVTEQYVYVVGKITFKYYALQDDTLTESTNDIYFKICPTEAHATILKEHIYKNEPPPQEVIAVFSNTQESPFILKDTFTEVVSGNDRDNYTLDFPNPRIINPVISDVTKHEGISYGTLAGTFYARFTFKEENEVVETVYECFGETGRKEEKTDEKNTYRRLEYYNSDCSTFWGSWIAEPISQVSSDSRTGFNKKGFRKWKGSFMSFGNLRSAGCGLIPLIFFVGLFIWYAFALFNPLIWLLVLIGIILFFRNSNYFVTGLFRLGTLLFAIFFTLAIWNLFTVKKSGVRQNVVSDKEEVSTIKPEDTQNRTRVNSRDNIEQIISHHRVWADYAGNRYEGDLKISVLDYEAAVGQHRMMDMQMEAESDWAGVYSSMIQNDRGRIARLYPLFDSIQNVKKLDQYQFAEMVVSCIQDIPYYIVLPNDCGVQGQNDPFVKNFLSENPESCLGNISFGVQSPAAFLGNLKGDCDTRVAMLFAIFNHYKYKVAILGSSQFRHAVLGIQLLGNGLSKEYNGVNYQMWETTSEGFRPGILAAEVSDLDYWNIYLTN